MKRLRYVAGVSVAVLGLAGCAGPTPPKPVQSKPVQPMRMGPMSLKPMLDNSEGYSEQYFSFSMLSPAAKAVLAVPGSEPLGFRHLTAKGEVEVAGLNSHRHVVFEQTMINDGNDGMVRGIERRSVDGLPLRIDYWSSYRGVAMLSVQSGLPARNLAMPITSVRSISDWKSMANVQEHTVYDYTGYYGYVDPRRPPVKLERRCTSGTFYDARKFLPELTGQAIDLSCDDINSSGAKTSELRFVWLSKYGVALIAKSITISGITTFKYDSVITTQ